jgi:hypothetical protein
MGKRLAPWQMIAFGIMLLGVADVLVFGIPVLWSNIVLLALVGIPLVGLDVGAMTLFQRNTEDRVRGRIIGLNYSIVAFSLLIGRGIATFTGDAIDVVPLLVATSLVTVLAGLVAFKLLREAGQAPVTTSSQVQAQPQVGG